MPSDKAITLNASRVLNTVGTAPKQMHHGIYLASVVNNNDPLGKGRVTLYVPQVLGTAVSNWAIPVGYKATDIPSPGTMVHAYFAGGDVNHPVYASISYDSKFSSINTSLASLQNQINNIQPGSWHSIGLASGWSNSGGSLIPAQARLILSGIAQIAGVLTYGSPGSLANGTLVGNLPSGLIPSSYEQVLPATVTGVSVADAFIGTVTGQTDTNGLSDGTTGGDSGIVVAGNAGSNIHQHFPGTYAVNNGTHVHTNLSAGQAASIDMNLSAPFITIDTSGDIVIWNASMNTEQITINGTIVI